LRGPGVGARGGGGLGGLRRPGRGADHLLLLALESTMVRAILLPSVCACLERNWRAFTFTFTSFNLTTKCRPNALSALRLMLSLVSGNSR
jgi:hypothetical protein